MIETSSDPVDELRSVVDSLLSNASLLESAARVDAAEVACRSAVLIDATPRSRLALADLLVRMERHSEARPLYESILAHDAAANDARLRMTVLHNLAITLRESGQKELAQARQGHAGRIEQEVSDGFSPEVLSGMAVDAIGHGELALAENLLLRSLSCEKARQNHAGVAADCGNLGTIALLRGRLAVAIRFFGRAFHLHRRLNDRRGAGTDLLNLAETFRQHSRWTLAARCLRRAIDCFEQCQARESLTTARQRLAEVQRFLEIVNHDPRWN